MRRVPTLSVFLVLLVLIPLAGCARTAPPPHPAPPGWGPATPLFRTPGTKTLYLRGLDVAVEATIGPAPNINPNAVDAKPPPPPPKGKVRITVHAEAYNYTDRAILLQIEHNLPRVQDSSGKDLIPVTGGLSARGTTGSKFEGTPEGLKAAGILEIVESFDLTPGQKGLRFDWNLGSAGEAKVTLP